MEHPVFDPPLVRKAALDCCTRARQIKVNDSSKRNENRWIWDEGKTWSEESVDKRMKALETNGSGNYAQIQFIAHVLEYVELVSRARLKDGRSSKASAINGLPSDFPIFGPIFYPAGVEYDCIREASVDNPERYLVEPVHVISPIYYPTFDLDACPSCLASTDPKIANNPTENVNRQGMPSTYTAIYGIERNMKVVGCNYKCKLHNITFRTTSPGVLERFPYYRAGSTLPYLTDSSGVTRALFNLIAECEIKSGNGELAEHLKQLHLKYDRHREIAWTDAVLARRAALSSSQAKISQFFSTKNAKTSPPVYPEVLVRANATRKAKRTEDVINPAPSANYVKEIYHAGFLPCRESENSLYTRSLTGRVLGIDATLRNSLKATITTVSKQEPDENGKRKEIRENKTVFNGGMATGVNEDFECVFHEFLFTNSPAEIIPPASEFAERSREFGTDNNFSQLGEIVVDKCCEFRGTINSANELKHCQVTQDLRHLTQRVTEEIPALNAHKTAFRKELNEAVILQWTNEESPTLYRPIAEALKKLSEFQEKYQKLPLWTDSVKAAFERYKGHVSKGCLDRKHKDRPCHTSSNENWHRYINQHAGRGKASSLRSIAGRTADAILRRNVRLTSSLSQADDSPQRLFRKALKGSHEVFLMVELQKKRSLLHGRDYPTLPNIKPDHRFGVVARPFTASESVAERIKRIKADYKVKDETDLLDSDFLIAENSVSLSGDCDETLKNAALGIEEPVSVFSYQTKRKRSIHDIADEHIYATVDSPSKRLNSSGNQISAPSTAKALTTSMTQSLTTRFATSPGQSMQETTSITNGSTNIALPVRITVQGQSMSNAHMPSNFDDSILSRLGKQPPKIPAPIATNNVQNSAKPLARGLANATGPASYQASRTFYNSASSHAEQDNGNTSPLPFSNTDEKSTILEEKSDIIVQAPPPTSSSLAPRQSTSAAYFESHSEISHADYAAGTGMDNERFFRLATLRIDREWSSKMTDTQWRDAAIVFNNPQTAAKYSSRYKNKDLSKVDVNNPISATTLKVECEKLEKSLLEKQAAVERNEKISEWWRFQLEQFTPEKKATTKKLKKDGKPALANTCHRCRKLRVGEIGGSHAQQVCDDGFLSRYSTVPYPLPKSITWTRQDPAGTSKRKLVLHEISISLAFIKLDTRRMALESSHTNIEPLTPEEINLRSFQLQAWDVNGNKWNFDEKRYKSGQR